MENIRDVRQLQAANEWERNNYRGLIASNTGFGKTRSVLTYCVKKYAAHIGRYPKVLYIVPRETNRDDDWPQELKIWVEPEYHDHYEGVCWPSVGSKNMDSYDMLILDEAHHITNRSYQHIKNFKGAIVGLTATPPTDEEKASMLRKVAPLVFRYALEAAVQEDISAPYILHQIYIYPNRIDKDVPAGSKENPFMQTEFAAHAYVDKQVRIAAAKGELDSWKGKAAIRKRMNLIYNSATKRRAARHILTKVYKPDKRILVFGGSIDQIEKLIPDYSHHSKKNYGKNESLLSLFRQEKINLLGTVGTVDEGANISNLDIGIIIQADQSERRMLQRLGRLVRKRENYIAHVYSLCLKGTQDEKWLDESTQSLPSYRIKRFVYDNLRAFQSTDEWIITT